MSEEKEVKDMTIPELQRNFWIGWADAKRLFAALAQARQEGIEIGAAGNAKISYRQRIKELEAENARLREALRPVDSNKKYRANFLWPCADGSIEQAAYEFANGYDEEYLHMWWDELCTRIRADQDAKSRADERRK